MARPSFSLSPLYITNNGSEPNGKEIELILISDYFKSLLFFFRFVFRFFEACVCFLRGFLSALRWKIKNFFLRLLDFPLDEQGEHDFWSKNE